MDIQKKYDALLARITREGTTEGMNLVAFSGGVDSSLVARAVYTVFPDRCEAIMALSPSVSAEMRQLATAIAGQIGIPLRFVQIEEYRDPVYVANEGMSCYICKSHIYDAMKVVSREAAAQAGEVLLYNGTNADDASDPTRVGLRAAQEFGVRSPLDRFTKEEIRALSRHAGLPNWNYAASPCLRSRLHAGVPATPEHLLRVENAETALRLLYGITEEMNFRVRHLPDDSAMIELDADVLDALDLTLCRTVLEDLGFTGVSSRAFRSGSVSIDPKSVISP